MTNLRKPLPRGPEWPKQAQFLRARCWGVHRGPNWRVWEIRKTRVQTGLVKTGYGPKWAISLLYRPSTRNKGSRARPGSVAREPGMAQIDPKIGVFLAISGPVLSRRGYQEAVFWAHFSGSPKKAKSGKSAPNCLSWPIGDLAKSPKKRHFWPNTPKYGIWPKSPKMTLLGQCNLTLGPTFGLKPQKSGFSGQSWTGQTRF